MAMRDGPEIGLQALAPLMEDATLHDYHLAHAARADLEVAPAQRGRGVLLERRGQPAWLVD